MIYFYIKLVVIIIIIISKWILKKNHLSWECEVCPPYTLHLFGPFSLNTLWTSWISMRFASLLRLHSWVTPIIRSWVAKFWGVNNNNKMKTILFLCEIYCMKMKIKVKSFFTHICSWQICWINWILPHL